MMVVQHSDVSFKTSDGLNIRGTFCVPSERPIAMALLLHGITVDRNEYQGFFRNAAEVLANSGIASLRIDFRGHGESDGNQEDFSVVGQILDTRAALNVLGAKFPHLATATVIGASFGAAPAIFSSVADERINRLCLFAPVLDYTRTFLEPTTKWAAASFNKSALELAYKNGHLLLDGSFKIGVRLIEEMRLLSPIAALSATQSKVTIIHGDQDSMVPYSVSKKVALDNQKILLKSILNMDHGYIDIDDPDGQSEKSKINLDSILHIFLEQCR